MTIKKTAQYADQVEYLPQTEKKKKKFCDKTVVVICMWLTLICSMREVRLLTICINGWLVIAFLKNIKKIMCYSTEQWGCQI